MVRGGFEVRFHQGSTRVPQEFHQGSTRVPPGFHQGSAKFPPGFHEVLQGWISPELFFFIAERWVLAQIGSGVVRGGFEVRFHQGCTRVPQEFHQGSARVPPGFRQGSAKVPPGFHEVLQGWISPELLFFFLLKDGS